jgi:hypothetical protein
MRKPSIYLIMPNSRGRESKEKLRRFEGGFTTVGIILSNLISAFY